jgi:hypothetical protein
MRYLAYRLQAQAHGDLDRYTKIAMEKIANWNLSPLETPRGPDTNLKPGIGLVRHSPAAGLVRAARSLRRLLIGKSARTKFPTQRRGIGAGICERALLRFPARHSSFPFSGNLES